MFWGWSAFWRKTQNH